MKKVLLLSALTIALAGCASGDKGGGVAGALGSLGGGSGSSSTENKVGAAVDVFKAVSVSDEELKSATLQLRAAEDKKARVATGKNKYAQRLARLTRKHVNEDGLQLNYKVYLSPQVNANATPDGSIRVYSGLMDLMTDNNDAEGLAGLPQWPVRAAGQACRLADVSLLPDADEHPARRATEVAAGERRLTEQPAQAHARRQPHLIQAQPVRQRAQ